MAGLSDMTIENWPDRFQGLQHLDERVRRKLVSQSRVRSFKKGDILFAPGKSPEHMLLLLDGTVRVQQQSDGGRSVVMYRVQAGESCVMTTACLLAFEDYAAEGIAETDIRAAMIPRVVFDDLLATSKEFREFVFRAYSKRITDLFYVIDEIAFKRVDIRLAQKLLALSDKTGVVKATHADLASELATAREVVSRQLSEFQRRGWVSLSRGAVEIADAQALEELASTT